MWSWSAVTVSEMLPMDLLGTGGWVAQPDLDDRVRAVDASTLFPKPVVRSTGGCTPHQPLSTRTDLQLPKVGNFATSATTFPVSPWAWQER